MRRYLGKKKGGSGGSLNKIDWRRFFEICVGMIGISPLEFWELSPIEIYMAIAGFKEFHTAEEKTPLDRDELERLMELHPD